MSFDQHIGLVTRLESKTEAGEIDWKKSIDEYSFQVSFARNTVRIRVDAFDGDDYSIQLLDSNGNMVESFNGDELDVSAFGSAREHVYRNMLSDIYAQARRRALGADKVLNEILNALDE